MEIDQQEDPHRRAIELLEESRPFENDLVCMIKNLTQWKKLGI